MKKFTIEGNPIINSVRLEEFLHETKSFSIKSNKFGELYFDDKFVGIMNSRTKADKGWKINISYLCISGAVVTDEIEVKQM